jgi:hypothetical protein
MKKITISILLALLAFGLFTGIASAQTTEEQTGTIHTYMVAALADRLNLTIDQVETRVNAGETMYEIALAEGIAEADLPAFLAEVRTAAIKAAVADGVITQTQADRMLQRGLHKRSGMVGFGTSTRTGSSTCTGTGVSTGSGMHGNGRGQQLNP